MANEASETPVDEDGAGESGADNKRHLEFSDAVEIPAPKTELWDTISDPATLTECVPGAESIERVSERKYTLEITRGVSHLSLSLSGEAEFVEMNAPDSIVTKGSAFESKTGSTFEILAAMEINETDAGCELVYTAEVEYSGGAASLTNSLLKPVVERDVDTYFDNVRAAVQGD
ncbi:MAG: CoxG family protein [Halodesulfurarchaeum sp.]